MKRVLTFLTVDTSVVSHLLFNKHCALDQCRNLRSCRTQVCLSLLPVIKKKTLLNHCTQKIYNDSKDLISQENMLSQGKAVSAHLNVTFFMLNKPHCSDKRAVASEKISSILMKQSVLCVRACVCFGRKLTYCISHCAT